MTDIRGEKVDPDKFWSACPNCATLREEVERIRHNTDDSINLLRVEYATIRGERDEALASIKRMQDYFGDVTVVAKECDALRARVKVLEDDYKSLQEAKDTVIKHYNLALEHIDQLEEAVEWALSHIDGFTSLQDWENFKPLLFRQELRRRAGRE